MLAWKHHINYLASYCDISARIMILKTFESLSGGLRTKCLSGGLGTGASQVGSGQATCWAASGQSGGRAGLGQAAHQEDCPLGGPCDGPPLWWALDRHPFWWAFDKPTICYEPDPPPFGSIAINSPRTIILGLKKIQKWHLKFLIFLPVVHPYLSAQFYWPREQHFF